MKKVLLVFLLSPLLFSFNLRAQNWVNGGNALTANGTLGTTTNFSLLFKTNNSERGRITNSGLWGIGTSAPNSKVHINSATGQVPFQVQVNGSTKLLVHSGGGVSIGSSTTPPSNGLFVAGNTGIGISTPKAALHVFKGSAGTITDFSSPALIVENSTNDYINLRAPNGSESGILFGNPSGGSADGGIIYNSVGNLKGLQFRTNGNIIKMVVTNLGSVGIGTTTPRARLDLGDPGESVGLLMTQSGFNEAVQIIKTSTTSPNAALDVSIAGSGNAIEGFSAKGNGIFGQTINPSKFAGFFAGNVFTTGMFIPSDEKLKQNIRDFTSAMGIINELHPKQYQFKKDGNYALMNLPQGDHYGLIALEVEKVLPNLVKETKFDTRLAKHEQTEISSPADEVDFKTLNYTELIPILIKGMQEQDAKIESSQLVNKQQQLVNEEQKLQIAMLKDQLAKLEAALATITANKNGNVSNVITTASLEQNKPNPFDKNTTIRYSIPQGSKGQINICDQTGRILKTLNANESGQSELSGYDLTAGVYTYTLIINGKVALSKQMVITK